MEGPRGMVLDHGPSILSNLGFTLFFHIIDSAAQRSELAKDQHFHSSTQIKTPNALEM